MSNLKQKMIDEFSSEGGQRFYKIKANDGFWDSEDFFIQKYFSSKGRLLDLGCGTGRTTIPLYQQGQDVVGVDISPAMIENAQLIAKEKSLLIDYRVGDATNLDFPDHSFDYIFFSNQGWTFISPANERQKAMDEMARVLKPGGTLIFTAHPRVIFGEYRSFWIKEWLRFYLLKPFGFPFKGVDFGDRFYDRESKDTEITYKTGQYIHIPSVNEVKKAIRKAGMTLLEANGDHQISKEDIRRHPPVFFICTK